MDMSKLFLMDSDYQTWYNKNTHIQINNYRLTHSVSKRLQFEMILSVIFSVLEPLLDNSD